MFLIRSIEIWHGLVALIEKDEGSAQPLLGKTANVLIHTRLGPRQKPKDSFDHEVGDEPSQPALRDCSMNIGCLKEVCDEAVDGQTSAECLTEDLELTELLGEG